MKTDNRTYMVDVKRATIDEVRDVAIAEAQGLHFAENLRVTGSEIGSGETNPSSIENDYDAGKSAIEEDDRCVYLRACVRASERSSK